MGFLFSFWSFAGCVAPWLIYINFLREMSYDPIWFLSSVHAVHLAQKLLRADEGEGKLSMMLSIHVTWCYVTASLSKIAHGFSPFVFIMWEKPVFCFNETCCSSEQKGGKFVCVCACLYVWASVKRMNPESRWKHITVGGIKHTHTHTPVLSA